MGPPPGGGRLAECGACGAVLGGFIMRPAAPLRAAILVALIAGSTAWGDGTDVNSTAEGLTTTTTSPGATTIPAAPTLTPRYGAPAGAGGPRVLRVCTTGDDPPLTVYDSETKEFSGLTPTVLRQFARSVGSELEMLLTSGDMLAETLANESECILAGGGIAATAEWTDQFDASIPVLSLKRVPVFSRHNEERFKTFDSFGEAGVVVFESAASGRDASYGAELKEHGSLSDAKVEVLSTIGEVLACLKEYPKLPLVYFADNFNGETWAAACADLSHKGADVAPPLDDTANVVFLASRSEEGQGVMKALNRFLLGARATGLLEAWRREAFQPCPGTRGARCPWKPPALV